MQRLDIAGFGPIKMCSIEIKDFMVFTGAQASGKSTIAKSIFFFCHSKNILFNLIQKNIEKKQLFQELSLSDRFERELRNVFVQAFGVEYYKSNSGTLTYIYDNGAKIIIHIEYSDGGVSVNITLDKHIKDGLNHLSKMLAQDQTTDIKMIREYIDKEIFTCDTDVIYIPAGRSLLTMLSSQINYLYATMDDQQKRTIDYCTQCYLEEVLRIKDFFKTDPRTIVKNVRDSVDYPLDQAEFDTAIGLIQDILKGEYRNVNGEERLYYADGEAVKLNYASSGQQEAVWITNILLYHLLGRKKTLFIIEEPESHLFPGTQKLMMEYISLAKNQHNKVIITTHSPYILGSMNNLLYANRISDAVDKSELGKIVSPHSWLSFDTLGAYFLNNGKPEDIADPEYEDINHDIIDGVSAEISEAYEAMLSLKENTGGEA